ncbi:Hypothetical predicted protein [Paramuricea clavata]|uniref:Uncharacterized protein n=1 Tax=Paramuricea clavata TaxID=317549 RepID=A0A6S7G2Z7_PARCT|nr:Hypothetical predicted protein [Paramuricea clavata]
MQGKINTTLRLLEENSSVGVLPLSDEVMKNLGKKHPLPSEIKSDSLLHGPITDLRDVAVDINEQDVLFFARLMRGSAGPSGLDANQYVRILCSKQFYCEGKSLREQIAMFAKKIASLDPSCLEAYTACRLIPLDKSPGNFDGVKQVWLADDCSAAGPLDSFFAFFNQTIVEGEKFGYYVNSTKSWLVVKKHYDPEGAAELFKDCDIKIATEGQRLLGAVIGSTTFKEEYVNSKVETWCNELNRLSDIAKCHPQAAYAAFVHGYKHKFTYCIRTIPDIGHLLKPVEEVIANVFLPTLLGQEISQIDRQIWALPTRLGGLGIPCIPNEAEFNLSSSKVISAQLCAQLVKHWISGLPSAEDLSHAKLTVRNDRRERLHAASLSLHHQARGLALSIEPTSEPSSKDSDPSLKGAEPSSKCSEPSSNGSAPSSNGSAPRSNGSEPSSNGSEPCFNDSVPSSNASEPSSQ